MIRVSTFMRSMFFSRPSDNDLHSEPCFVGLRSTQKTGSSPESQKPVIWKHIINSTVRPIFSHLLIASQSGFEKTAMLFGIRVCVHGDNVQSY